MIRKISSLIGPSLGADRKLGTMTKFCRLESTDYVLTVTIDRPEVLNSLHPEASYELAEVFDQFESDDSHRVAIITGAGDRAFCAGLDLKSQAKRAIVVLAAVKDQKVQLVVGVTEDITDTVHAGKLLSAIAKALGGKGGGRADMAQGGASEPEKLESVLAHVQKWI